MNHGFQVEYLQNANRALETEKIDLESRLNAAIERKHDAAHEAICATKERNDILNELEITEGLAKLSILFLNRLGSVCFHQKTICKELKLFIHRIVPRTFLQSLNQFTIWNQIVKILLCSTEVFCLRNF